MRREVNVAAAFMSSTSLGSSLPLDFFVVLGFFLVSRRELLGAWERVRSATDVLMEDREPAGFLLEDGVPAGLTGAGTCGS